MTFVSWDIPCIKKTLQLQQQQQRNWYGQTITA